MPLSSLTTGLATAMLVHHAPGVTTLSPPAAIDSTLTLAASIASLSTARAQSSADGGIVADRSTTALLETIHTLRATTHLADGTSSLPPRLPESDAIGDVIARRSAPRAGSTELNGCGCTLSAAHGYLETGVTFWLPEAQRGTPVAFEVTTSAGTASFTIAHGASQGEILAKIQAACAPIEVQALIAPENDRRILLENVGCEYSFFPAELTIRQLERPGVEHQPRLFGEPDEATPRRRIDAHTSGPARIRIASRGDVNCDAARDFDDLIAILAHWGTSDPAYEFTYDGVVDGEEVAQLLDRWGLIRSPDLYVDATAPAGGDGTSWETAFRHLRDALDSIKLDPHPDFTRRYTGGVVVRVAHGTYRPDRTERTPEGSGQRSRRFNIPEGTTVIGGFAGRGAADPDAHDPVAYETILDGDLLGDDGPDGAQRDDNSRTVVRLVGSTLSSATVRGATRFAIFDDEGIGHPSTLRNVHVTDNHCDVIPVGFNEFDRVIDCRFSDNAGLEGGALRVRAGSVVERSTFVGNRSDNGGGAIIALSADITISNCFFVGNESPAGGSIQAVDAFVTNCLFTDHDGADAIIDGPAQILNSIFWANTAPLFNALSDPPLFSYCIVPARTPGAGNLVADPQWVDPGQNDFTLAPGSPAIDAGDTATHPVGFPIDGAGGARVLDDPATPDSGIPRETDAVIDIGPHEFDGGG